MRLAAVILGLVSVFVAAIVAAFFHYFTLVPTVRGDEYLVLRAEQAAECALGGGCAVFSEREWLQSVQSIVLQLRERERQQGGKAL